MIDYSKIECTGCSACTSVCKFGAIAMDTDEAGFPTPRVIDSQKCVKCGLCEKVCRFLNPKAEEKNPDELALIAQVKDNIIRRESASGGMFSAIALVVLDKGGIVYGAAYNKEFKVQHIGVERIDQLWKLRNSKYVQSDLGNVFREIKTHLINNRLVCFSGTPCQVEGLSAFLQKPYKNLVLVDITCHGIGSPLVWDKYLELVKKYSPERIYFRWKHFGYKYSTMSYFDKDMRELYFGGVETDKMLRAYFTNNCDRSTCYKCRFKKRYRISDITLWDCFQPRFFNKDFDDDRGTSSVLINTSKGREILNEIIEKNLIEFQMVDPDELVYGNKELVQSVIKGDTRDLLIKDAQIMSGQELFEKYFPETTMVKIKNILRTLLLKSGLYSFVKYAIYKYRRDRSSR